MPRPRIIHRGLGHHWALTGVHGQGGIGHGHRASRARSFGIGHSSIGRRAGIHSQPGVSGPGIIAAPFLSSFRPVTAASTVGRRHRPGSSSGAAGSSARRRAAAGPGGRRQRPPGLPVVGSSGPAGLGTASGQTPGDGFIGRRALLSGAFGHRPPGHPPAQRDQRSFQRWGGNAFSFNGHRTGTAPGKSTGRARRADTLSFRASFGLSSTSPTSPGVRPGHLDRRQPSGRSRAVSGICIAIGSVTPASSGIIPGGIGPGGPAFRAFNHWRRPGQAGRRLSASPAGFDLAGFPGCRTGLSSLPLHRYTGLGYVIRRQAFRPAHSGRQARAGVCFASAGLSGSSSCAAFVSGQV